jgi:hypothetical protein
MHDAPLPPITPLPSISTLADPILALDLNSDGVLLLIVGGVVTLIVLIRSVAGILRTNARERSRREIAAFIAEGSMTPEQGERLMRAGESKDA